MYTPPTRSSRRRRAALRWRPSFTLSLAPSLIFSLAALSGCEKAAQAPQHSAWAKVNDAFSVELYDPAARQRNFSGEALNALALPSLVGQDRYTFLYIDDLRRVDDATRRGRIAFSVDGWPMILGFTASRTPEGPWRVTDVDAPDRQRVRLALIGEDGLPSAPSARPWRGGLAARDQVGRPTASVLILADEEGLEVDGHEVPGDDRPQQIRALREAISLRTRLANDAHAGYTPQVAIALPRRAPAGQLPDLMALAAEGGAQEILLVVRGAKGGPALYPLGRITDAEEEAPLIVEAQAQEEGLALAVGEWQVLIPRKGPTVDRGKLSAALDALSEAGLDPVGLRLRPWSGGEHRHTVAILDAVRAAAPGLPVIVEAGS